MSTKFSINISEYDCILFLTQYFERNGHLLILKRLSFDQLDLFCVNMKKLIDYKRNQGALGSITDVFGDFSPKLSLDY